MFGWMMFGEIIGQVVLSFCTIHLIVSLSHYVAYIIESHANFSVLFLYDVSAHKSVARCAVCDDWCRRLLMAHFSREILRAAPR